MIDFSSEINSCRGFGERLKFHLFRHGTRPDGSPSKEGEKKWGVKEFSRAIRKSDKSVQNWMNDRKRPPDLFLIETALFGANPNYDTWRKGLRDAHRLARAHAQSDGEKEPELSGTVSPAQSSSPSVVQILHPEIRPVPGFTGRKDLLAGIDAALWRKNGGTAALTNDAASAAVKGLGGVGKSVLARQYAWHNRERYRGVWWVRAETEQTLVDDLIDLGSRLIPNLRENHEPDRALYLALDAVAGAGGASPG